MNAFNHLVLEQMKTMDKLLFLQSRLEKCQEIERGLMELHEESKLQLIQLQINQLKNELKEIHKVFEQQTENVIRSYQEMNVIC